MGFKEELQKLSVQVNERKVHIINEEMTKQALIIPFIQVLGFDVFNPLEVRPEYVADFGKKKGEKVDYALFKDSTPIIFVEAKSVTEDLTNHDAQLSRYFNAVTDIKLAILTNGLEYKFFTDLNSNNVMDESPFLTIDITKLKDSDIENLNKFKKESFDKDFLVKYAEELVYTSALDNSLKELFRNPSDEFIRFLIKDFSETRITNTVIERFRPIVKKAISNAVLDIVTKGLYQQELVLNDNPQIQNTSVQDELIDMDQDDTSKKKGIVTTKEELKSFDIVKNILSKNNKETSGLNYKDTTNYFSIYKDNTTKWFVRINLDSANKNIITKLKVDELKFLGDNYTIEAAPKGIGESRIHINSVDDIPKLENLILACFDNIA